MLPSDNKNSEPESNSMQYQLYLHISESVFSVSFTAPDKQSFRVKSAFKSRDHLSNSLTINKFTTLFRVKGALSSCFKQFP